MRSRYGSGRRAGLRRAHYAVGHSPEHKQVQGSQRMPIGSSPHTTRLKAGALREDGAASRLIFHGELQCRGPRHFHLRPQPQQAAGDEVLDAPEVDRVAERERYRVAALLPLRQRTEATLAAYRANQASLVGLFEARHAELDGERKLLTLQRDLARVRAQLVFKPVVQGAQP